MYSGVLQCTPVYTSITRGVLFLHSIDRARLRFLPGFVASVGSDWYLVLVNVELPVDTNQNRIFVTRNLPR